LTQIYKEERQIFNQDKKKNQQITSISIESPRNHNSENHEEAEKNEKDENQEVDQKEVVITEEEAPVVTNPTQSNNEKGDDRINRNIKVRLGITMAEIMNIYSLKRDRVKSNRFKEEAEKFLREGLNEDKTHKYYVKYLGSVGDMLLRYGSKKELDQAYEAYDAENKALMSTVGKYDIDFINSMCDVGDVHFERKSYEEAEAFYGHWKVQFEEVYGKDNIFKTRVNSALVELYSAMGAEYRQKAYDMAMENVDTAMKYHGENSLFLLSFLMSGMSANIQKGLSNMAENMLTKMMRILEDKKEIQNGNQYLYLAWILLGVVWYSGGKYEQAHLYFTNTMKKQIEYVEDEKDHPFLEQTYMHMAVMYKQIGNLNSSNIMWKNLLRTHQRLYGDNNHILSADYKNIGTWEIGIGATQEGIESLEKAKEFAKRGLEEIEDKEDIAAQKREIAEIYFALYLGYVSKSDWDNAIIANEQALKLNLELLGENDLNVANNYYLGAQIFLKKLSIDEALHNINKANEIIDRSQNKEPLLLWRYRYLRAKLYKNKENNKEAIKNLDDAIAVAEGNPRLFNDEYEIKEFRRNLINCLTDEEMKEYGIDKIEESKKKETDNIRKKEIENQIRMEYAKRSLQSQGIDPNTVNPKTLTGENEKVNEDEEEGFLDSPLGFATVAGGAIALGLGIFYLFSKSK
jgi:tetratricopeptide (TPR) repeat protein